MARPPLPGRAGSLGDPHGLWRPWSHPTACARLPVARFGCGGTGLPTPSCLQLPAQGCQAQPHARGGHTRSCVCKHKTRTSTAARSPAHARHRREPRACPRRRAEPYAYVHARSTAEPCTRKHVCTRHAGESPVHACTRMGCTELCTLVHVQRCPCTNTHGLCTQTRARKRMHCTEPCSHACVCIHTLPPVQTHGALFMHTHTCIHTTLPCTPTEPCSHTHTCIYTHPPPTHNPGALHSPTAAPTPTPLAAASPLLLF